MRKLRLFCFPYAGGSAVVYNKWQELLDKNIRLCPVELAGRGKRIADPFYNSVEETAEDIIKIIRYDLMHSAFAFFGHSLGAIIAYRVSQKLKEKRMPEPVHVFFSGRGAPHIKRSDKKPYHTLPDDEFKERILDLGGTPREFFEHPELLEILVPLLKSDFRNSWEYVHPKEPNPLNCNITVFTGTTEDLKPEQIEGWQEHTKGECTRHCLEGGHFFLNSQENRETMLGIINETLARFSGRSMWPHA